MSGVDTANLALHPITVAAKLAMIPIPLSIYPKSFIFTAATVSNTVAMTTNRGDQQQIRHLLLLGRRKLAIFSRYITC